MNQAIPTASLNAPHQGKSGKQRAGKTLLILLSLGLLSLVIILRIPAKSHVYWTADDGASYAEITTIATPSGQSGQPVLVNPD